MHMVNERHARSDTRHSLRKPSLPLIVPIAMVRFLTFSACKKLTIVPVAICEAAMIKGDSNYEGLLASTIRTVHM